jgi:hypothetical protein
MAFMFFIFKLLYPNRALTGDTKMGCLESADDSADVYHQPCKYVVSDMGIQTKFIVMKRKKKKYDLLWVCPNRNAM